MPNPAPGRTTRPEEDEIEAENGADPAPLRPRRGVFHEERHPGAAEGRSPPHGRGDGDAARVARRAGGGPALAEFGRRARPRARDPRRLRRGRLAGALHEHVGREPREALEVRLGRLAREDQPRGRAPRPRRGRGGIRLRGGIRRAARTAREALRAAHAPPRARALHGADPDPPRGRRRPSVLRDVLLDARGHRGAARRARPVGRDSDRRLDDVPRGRQDELRRGRGRRAPSARRRGRRRRRDELHGRAPGDVRELLARRRVGDVPVSVRPNAGYPWVVSGRTVYPATPDYFRQSARDFVRAGAALVGGCCGTAPEHVAAMAREVAGKARTVPAPAPAAPSS